MFYTIDTSHCPKCNNCYESKLMGLSTCLGPVLAKCNRCGTVFKSGKKEWSQMSVIQKNLFWILSILYAIIIGVSCGIMASCLPKILFYGRVGNWPQSYSQFSMISAIVFTLAFIIFIFYLQVIRIKNSNIRSLIKYDKQVPIITSIIGAEFGLQQQFSGLFTILLCIVGLALTYFK